MSRGIEEVPDKRVNLSNMSERQALLYFQNGGGNEDTTKEKPSSLLDYHQYFLSRRDANHAQLDKNKAIERNKVLKLAMKEYTSIKKNIYIDRKKCVFTDEEAFVCACNPKKYTQSEAKKIIDAGYAGKSEEEMFGCGWACINKMVSWECVEHLCPCGASCRNRKFQNHEYADVYPIKTEDRGFGLCAASFLPKGTFVIQYIGEVYSVDSDLGQKKLEEYKDHTCTYLMSLSKKEVIDPTTKGNFARFINHSCDPNCQTQKWHVLGEVCVGIFTSKDVQPDEELTFDYGFDILKTTFQKCLCGAEKCRGYLGIVTNDSPKAGQSVICEACKSHCKPSEPILVCDSCKKVYHKSCSKKGKGNNLNYTCNHCLKKGVPKKIEVKEKVVKIEEEPIYDENYEVGDEELGKIRKNLPELINCGARLFWDFQLQNSILGTTKKLDIKITGTSSQIENVKLNIKLLREQKSDSNSLYVVKLQVPKIFVRKIIGHQNRNLNSYKSKFSVEIDYDISLITDEIFPIQDSSCIQIKGKENNVKAVENDIKSYLYNLKVLSFFLMPPDYSFIKGNICNLKTIIDPADVRLRKREFKNERDLKHPFYFISNTNRDIVIIGFDREVEKGEKIIKEFILRHNTLLFNYSLSFLYPIYFRKQLSCFFTENKNVIKDKKIYLDLIEPEYLRRHLSIYLEGKWKDITDIKNGLWKYVKDSPDDGVSTVTGKKHSITEFEQYAFNQEHKLISKSIKNNIIDSTYQIKNWDYISVDVLKLLSSKEEKEGGHQLIHAVNHSSYVKKQQECSSLLKNFPVSCDRDTKLNYMLNYPPGSYAAIFKQSQNEVASNLLSLVTEAYDSYKESKLKGNINSAAQDSKELLSNTNKPPSLMIIEEKSCTLNQEENIKVKQDQPEHVLLKQELTGILKENGDMNLNLQYMNSAFSLTSPIEAIPVSVIDQGMSSQVSQADKGPITKKEQVAEAKGIKTQPKSVSKANEMQSSPPEKEIKKDVIMEGSENRDAQTNAPNESDPMKISYSFPTIQQMNINININDIKNFIDKKDSKLSIGNEGEYVNFLPIKKEVNPKQPKLIQGKSSQGKSKSRNDSESNSSYLHRKTKRSKGKGGSPYDKHAHKSSHKHHYHYHYPSKDKEASWNINYAYGKKKELFHHISQSYYDSSTYENHHHSSSSMSPNRKSHLNYNANSKYDYPSEYPSNYKAKHGKYDTINPKYEGGSSKESKGYSSKYYSKPYHQPKYYDSHDRREQSANYASGYSGYHDRDKQNEAVHSLARYQRSRSPHSSFHSREYSRQRSRSPNQKYGYPHGSHYSTKKREQKQSSVAEDNDSPSPHYQQASDPRLKSNL